MIASTFKALGLAAVAAVAFAGVAQAQSKSLTLGTASVGGTYFIYGGVVATLVTEKTGINVSTQQTQGPNQNLLLVDSKAIELGMVTMGVALQAWEGQGEWTRGNKFRNIRALFPMYDTPFHAVALKRSGITDHSQLNGKSVGVGPRGGTPGTYYPLILRTLGVTPSRIGYGSGADMIGQVSDGLLDCFAFAAGVPIPAFSEIETTNEVTIFGFTDAQMDTIVKAYPELSKGTVPAGTYRSVQGPINIVGVYNFAIGHKDLPEDLVYEIVKSIMTQNAALVQAISTAKETVPQNVTKNSFLPFHPGAARWFRENGHAIPDNLIMA